MARRAQGGAGRETPAQDRLCCACARGRERHTEGDGENTTDLCLTGSLPVCGVTNLPSEVRRHALAFN